MIYKPNNAMPYQIGSPHEHNFFDKFYFFYEPHDVIFSGTTPATGTAYTYLSSNIYGEYCAWNAPAVTFNGSLGARKKIEAVIFGNPSFNNVKGKFYDGTQIVFDFDNIEWITNTAVGIITHNTHKQLIFKKQGQNYGTNLVRRLAPGESYLDITDQGILIFLTDFYADRFEMILSGTAALNTLYSFYVGLRKSVVIGSGAAYPLIGTGEGKVDDLGHVYGVKWPARREFQYEWDIFDDTDRRVVERLIAGVQNVDPHYILPFALDNDFIPPMFARLTTQELHNQRWRAGWFWEKPSLKWEVVR